MARSTPSGMFRSLLFFALFLYAATGICVAQEDTTTVLTVPTSATLGTPATLTATVADTPTPATAPVGVVSFFDGGVLIGSATLDGAAPGVATFSTSVLSVGSHSITATFVAANLANFNPSSASAVLQPIAQRTTTTSIAVTSLITVRSATAVSAAVNDQTFGASSGTSTATGNNLTINRFGHSATRLPDGTVLIVGGSTDGSAANAQKNAEIYDPVGGTFTALDATCVTLAKCLATARLGHTATLLPNGTVLIAGGTDTGGVSLASAEIYDPVAKTFASANPLNV